MKINHSSTTITIIALRHDKTINLLQITTIFSNKVGRWFTRSFHLNHHHHRQSIKQIKLDFILHCNWKNSIRSWIWRQSAVCIIIVITIIVIVVVDRWWRWWISSVRQLSRIKNSSAMHCDSQTQQSSPSIFEWHRLCCLLLVDFFVGYVKNKFSFFFVTNRWPWRRLSTKST